LFCFFARVPEPARYRRVFRMIQRQRGNEMPTASGHTSAILASKVKGTTVYNSQGDKIGQVEDVVLDKQSDHILFAALGFGGVLGMGEKFYPVPWSILDYDAKKGGYVVPIEKDQIDKAPAYRLEDLTRNDGDLSEIRDRSYSYYDVARDW
jgi:sporulation protein YlmC with PRC-barrel domain